MLGIEKIDKDLLHRCFRAAIRKGMKSLIADSLPKHDEESLYHEAELSVKRFNLVVKAGGHFGIIKAEPLNAEESKKLTEQIVYFWALGEMKSQLQELLVDLWAKRGINREVFKESPPPSLKK